LLCFLLILPLLRMMPADAQTQPVAEINSERELDSRIRLFFESLSRGNTTSAFETSMRTSPLSSSINDASIAEMRSRVESMRIQFGAILNWEKLDPKRIGDDVILLRYILKYEQYPVLWTFAYYRNPNTNAWVLIGQNFDTDVFQY